MSNQKLSAKAGQLQSAHSASIPGSINLPSPKARSKFTVSGGAEYMNLLSPQIEALTM